MPPFLRGHVIRAVKSGEVVIVFLYAPEPAVFKLIALRFIKIRLLKKVGVPDIQRENLTGSFAAECAYESAERAVNNPAQLFGQL